MGGGPPPPSDAPQQDFYTQRGLPRYTEEGVDLQGFTPARMHLSLRELYGDFTQHNDGTHLIGGVPDDAIWKIHWRKLAAQSASWYSMPPCKVGHRFNAVLAAEW